MHRLDEETLQLEKAIVQYALGRVALQPPPLDGPKSETELAAMYGSNVTEDGIGGEEALRRFIEGYAPATLSSDHPRFLAFVPVAPTKASVLFDMVVSASCISGTSWLEAAGAVHCENEALRWLADLAGLPASAGGTFVSGGSLANLSGLHAARQRLKERRDFERPDRWRVLSSHEAHSSIASAASLMDLEVIYVPTGDDQKLTGENLAEVWSELPEEVRGSIVAVVATAGTTNAGLVDDLRSVSTFTQQHDLWLHVDGAYGGAALASKERWRFEGIENADSLVIDPHKWLFAPFDAAAILYREPKYAKHALTQEAAYLDDINKAEEWNPSSYGYHLSRRVRGLPFWFSLATNGTRRYQEGIQASIDLSRSTVTEIQQRDYLEMVMEPELSVVLFRRLGWDSHLYDRWSAQALHDGVGFVLPTEHRGEKVLRFCFVNPLTTVDDVRAILDSLAWEPRG
ncbi:aminotransferase class I/II-fold pyridoxal phosphate-dependent enzyme [Ferrimicrobium sp.]|uniref:pyridoxal phosphate-dependent decarboxylase family protein n=1 Tax=Ferrimicrobium sp. TaxID=2926050 RepID=UPI002602E118|nr:aminotransferase class I/II-fold pyridoxal phosphate-dependent enzyme [Ferrimicrobium sp.]